MDTDPIDVTAILAQPREFARRYENMRAQVAQAQAERDAARADLIHVAEQWHGSEKNLEAARAEVARLTQVIEAYSSPALQSQYRNLLAALRAALRGDQAPAQAAARDAMIEILEDDPAPAQPDATTLSDNSTQTSSQAPATGRE